jgi:hypothetical protein
MIFLAAGAAAIKTSGCPSLSERPTADEYSLYQACMDDRERIGRGGAP